MDNLVGFNTLIKNLDNYIEKANSIESILEEGAKAYTNDLLKLSKPMSKITKQDYTHLVDSFTYKKNGKEIEVGWGKYYGRMVELGTIKTRPIPHFYPVWDKNKDKYMNLMLNRIQK